jgi:hypothetical protein
MSERKKCSGLSQFQKPVRKENAVRSAFLVVQSTATNIIKQGRNDRTGVNVLFESLLLQRVSQNLDIYSSFNSTCDRSIPANGARLGSHTSPIYLWFQKPSVEVKRPGLIPWIVTPFTPPQLKPRS